MSKHRWRESLQSLRENHIHPEKDEQLKLSKIEIQNKLSKLLKLANDRRQNRKNRNAEVTQLVDDYTRQYQIIYDLHVNLRKQLAQMYDEITEEGYYTASSDSSSETGEDNCPNGSLELETRNQEVEVIKQKEVEKESENLNHMESLSKIEELEKIIRLLEDESKQLKTKLGDKEASVLIKDLEAQIESLNHENKQLKEQTEYESKAIKQLQMKESDLESLVLSLKKAMEDKEDELSALHPTVKGLESEWNGLERKLRELEEQLLSKDQENICFKDEVDSLLGKVSKLENMVKEYENQDVTKGGGGDKSARIGELMLEVNRLNSDKEVLQKRIVELEKQLEDRGDQSKVSVQMEALTREVNQLQHEVDVKRNDEIKTLHKEKEALEGKLLELEITLTQREDKVAKLNKKLLLSENESSTRIGLLNTQMNSLQQHLSNEREKSLEKLTLLEKQNAELTRKTSDQQMILKQQEDTINSLRADCKLVKSRLLQAADRKMEEMAEEFRKSFEANIRILRQRIRVAEQLQSENKESWKSIKERCEQEHLGLEKKVQEYSRMMAKSKGDITSFFDATNKMLDGLQSLFNRFEDKEGEFSGRISSVLDEITVMKNLVKVTAIEMKPVVKDECGTRDAITLDVDDKMRLMRGMHELQKKVAELEKGAMEKEEVVLKLVEEKKDAIRQLCISVEYHQNRCDQLIKLLNKGRGRS